MAIRTPQDELLQSQTPVGDVTRDANVALPGEFPEQTNARVLKEAAATRTARVFKAREFAARNIPSFVDQTGEVQAVRDETGAALTGHVPSKNIAFDSSGNPRKLNYGETGAPTLDDPFANLPTKTDKKTGVMTKSIPGVGTQTVGTDAGVAARAALAAENKGISQASTALNQRVSLDARELKAGAKDFETRKSELASLVPGFLGSGDLTPDAANAAIESHFEKLKTKGAAGKKTGWFGFGDPTEEAKVAQSDIEMQKQAALAKSRELFELQTSLAQRKSALESARAQAAAMAREKSERQLAALREQGFDVPDSVDALPVNPETGDRVMPPAVQRPKDAQGNVIGTTPQANAADMLAKIEATPANKLPPIDAAEQWAKTEGISMVPFLGTAAEISDLGAVGLAAMRLKNDEATQEDLALLKDYVDRESRDKTFGAKVVSVLSALPAFAGELAMTAGIYSIGSKAGKEAGKAALEYVLKKEGRELLNSKLAQFGVKALGATAGSLAQLVPAGGLRWGKQTMERMLPGVAVNEADNGELVGAITKEGDDFLPALRKAGGDTFVELLSERTGGALKFLPGASKIQGLKAALVQRWFGRNPGAPVSAFTQFLKRAGWHGVVGEMFEERVGDVMRGVGAAGEEFAKGNAGGAMTAFLKDSIPSLEQLAVEGVSFSVPGAAFSAHGAYKGRQFQQQMSEVAQGYQAADEKVDADPRFAPTHANAAAFIVGQHESAAKEAVDTMNGVLKFTPEERTDAETMLNRGGSQVFVAQSLGEEARASGDFDPEAQALDEQLQADGVEIPERRAAIINHTLGSSIMAKTLNEVATNQPISRPESLDQLQKLGVVTVMKGPAGAREVRLTEEAIQLLPPDMQARVQAVAPAAPNAALTSAIANGRTAIRNVAAAISPYTPGESAVDDLFQDPVEAASPEPGEQVSVEPQAAGSQLSTTEPVERSAATDAPSFDGLSKDEFTRKFGDPLSNEDEGRSSLVGAYRPPDDRMLVAREHHFLTTFGYDAKKDPDTAGFFFAPDASLEERVNAMDSVTDAEGVDGQFISLRSLSEANGDVYEAIQIQKNRDSSSAVKSTESTGPATGQSPTASSEQSASTPEAPAAEADTAGQERQTNVRASEERIEAGSPESTPEQQSLEQRIEASKAELTELLNDPARALEEAKGPQGIPIITVDDVIARTSAMQSATVEEGPTVFWALKPLADKVRHATFDYALSLPTRTGRVLLTAGGPGSGKSTISKKETDADFIYDSILGNADDAIKRIDRIRATDREVLIAGVLRDPIDAMRGNLERSLVEKRVVPADDVAQAHHDFRRAIKQLANHYADSPDVTVVAVETLRGFPEQEVFIGSIPDLDLDQTKADMHGVINAVANGTDSAWTGGELPGEVISAARGRPVEVSSNDRGAERGHRGSEADGGSASRLGEPPDAEGGQQQLELGSPEAEAEPSADELPPQIATEVSDPLTEEPFEPGAASSHDIKIENLPTPEWTGEKVATREAINAMADVLTAAGKTVPIRTGRFRQRALGIWKDFPEVIRLKTANDVATAAHEVGHGLQKVVYKSVKSSALKALPANVKAELVKLGRALYGSRKPVAGYTSEGFAEFTRIFLTADNAALVAPATHDFLLNTVLPAFPEVQKAFTAAKEKLNQYRAQGIQNKVGADVVDPNSWRMRLARIKEAFRPGNFRKVWVDEFEPLHQLSQEAAEKLGRSLEIDEDGFKVASALRGVAPHRVQYMAKHGMIDFNGTLVGPSLEQALEPIKGRQDEFMLYLWAEHALERWADGKNPGMSQEEAKFLVDTLGADPKFQIAAQAYWNWNQGLMNYVAQASPALKPLVERMTAKWKKYIPLARWFDPSEVKSAVSAIQEGDNTSTAMKRITKTGSGREILEPMPVLLKNAEKWIELAHKQVVLDTVVKMADIPGLGYRIEEVPREMQGQTVTVGQVRDALEKAGLDTTGIDDAEVLNFFTPMVQPKGNDPIIAHSSMEPNPETGANELKTRWYFVDPRVFDALEGVNMYRLPKALDLVLGMPARLFRLGTTGLRASFSMFTNPARDLPTLLMQSQSDGSSRSLLKAWLQSFAELWNPNRLRGKRSPLVDMFDRLGMQVGQPLGIDMQPIKQEQNRTIGGKTVHRVNNLLEMLRELFSITEAAPRLAEMREIAKEVGWDWKSGAPMTTRQMLQIMLATKQVTVDFSAAGTLSKKINQAVPFFNATIQGMRAFGRAWQRNPLRTALMGATWMTIPALLLWWKNKDEEWYQDLPWRDRFLYFNIPVGNQLIQIPRPMEWGNFFSTAPEALFDSVYREDPEAFQKAFGHIFTSSNPVDLPVLLRAAKEQWQNKTDFFDRPIIPRSETDMLPGEQRSPYTSGLANFLGDTFPKSISPRRVDAAIRALTGGAVGDFAKDIETLTNVLGITQKGRDLQPSDLPVFGRAFNKGGTDSGDSLAVQKFYEEFDKANGRARSKMMPETEADRVRRAMLKDAQKALKVLTAARMLATTLEQEQAINRKIREVATQAVTIAPAASEPKPVDYKTAKESTAEKPKGPVIRPRPFQSIIDAGKKPARDQSRMLQGI